MNADGFLSRNPVSVISLRLCFPQSAIEGKEATYHEPVQCSFWRDLHLSSLSRTPYTTESVVSKHNIPQGVTPCQAERWGQEYWKGL